MSRGLPAAGSAVVVPAIGTGSSLATIRSLGRRGVRTVAVAESSTAPATRSKYCDETVRVPSPQEDLDGYEEALLGVSQRDDVRTIVPLREPDIYVLAQNRERFADSIATPWPDYETVALAQDRLQLVEAAKRAGVATPETRPLDEWDDWGQPTVIKSRYSVVASDNGTSYPGVQFHEAGDEPDVQAIVDEMGHVPIVQEYVPGDAEHGFFALYDSGEPVATFAHRRIRSYTYSGGASVFRKSVVVPPLEDSGGALLDHLDWHGPAMVEFKRDPRDGTYRLMEINPRFWGSLALPIHAGVDFPVLYYQLAEGGVDRPVFEYEEGVGSHLLSGEGSYLNSLLRDEHDHVEKPAFGDAVGNIARSLWRHPNFDILSTDDPHPFVRDAVNTAAQLIDSTGVPTRI